MNKKILPKKKKPRKKLSAQEKAKIKEQKAQQTEITNILKNIGFYRIPYMMARNSNMMVGLPKWMIFSFMKM